MKYSHTLGIIVALAAISITYADSFHNAFHFDDFHTVVDNPAIRNLRNIPQFFSDVTTFSVLPANRTYRPLVSTSLAIDYWLGGGLNPLFFHVGTFLIYLVQIVGMQALFRWILDRTRPQPANTLIAAFAATWYGVHPAMAETVNYVIQRGDIYSTCGVVLALVFYAVLPKLRSTGFYLIPFAAALLSKPPAIVFPVLLFALMAIFDAPRERRFRTSAPRSIPAVAVGGLLIWLQVAMTPKSYSPSTLSNFSWYITQPFVLLRYFSSFFLPLHLNADTDLRPFATVNAEAVAGFVFVIVLVAVITLLIRRPDYRPIMFGLLWFLIASLPTSMYRLSEVENDHRMFMPFVGLVIAVTWAAYLALDRFVNPSQYRWGWNAVALAGMLMLCGYAWGTHLRNNVWRSEESLWLDDVQKCPENGRGLMIYGLTQMNKGNYSVALAYFERALRYTPNYPTLEINLGVVNGAIAGEGDTARSAIAEQHFQRAILLAPNDDAPHTYFGRWLESQGRIAEAIEQLKSGIALNPQRLMQRDLLIQAYNQADDAQSSHALALETLRLDPSDEIAKSALLHPENPARSSAYWINHSLAQYRQQDFGQAITSARRALEIDPNAAEAYNNIGASYGAMHRWDEAVSNERIALRLNPNLQIAKNNLALFLQKKAPGDEPPAIQPAEAALINRSLTLYQAGKFEASIQAAEEALRLDPNSAEAWNNIAAGDASLRRWNAAIVAAGKAIALKPDFQLAKNNLAWAQAQAQSVYRRVAPR